MAGRPAPPAPASRLLPFHTPAAGFDEPFEMLDACHDRVRRTLSLLLRLGRHLAKQDSVDRQARDAAADVIRYFDVAAPLHHQDEERHLLPLLRSDPDPAGARVAGRVERDHARLHAAWQPVREDLQRIQAGERPALDAFRQRWRRFSARYRAHIHLEDMLAYPAVRPRMPAEALRMMGEEMARRRGVRTAPGPGSPG
ncbi:MAG: hemerythrin domain-containing protein [Lautropia sp.]